MNRYWYNLGILFFFAYCLFLHEGLSADAQPWVMMGVLIGLVTIQIIRRMSLGISIFSWRAKDLIRIHTE